MMNSRHRCPRGSFNLQSLPIPQPKHEDNDEGVGASAPQDKEHAVDEAEEPPPPEA